MEGNAEVLKLIMGSWLVERYRVKDEEKVPGGGGTPLYGLYGDVPLDRVWFLASSVLNRVYNFMRTCPRQGLNLS